jgi:hypothetical protein
MMGVKQSSCIIFISLVLSSGFALAEVNGGTGGTQEALSALEWLLSWLPL